MHIAVPVTGVLRHTQTVDEASIDAHSITVRRLDHEHARMTSFQVVATLARSRVARRDPEVTCIDILIIEGGEVLAADTLRIVGAIRIDEVRSSLLISTQG